MWYAVSFSPSSLASRWRSCSRRSEGSKPPSVRIVLNRSPERRAIRSGSRYGEQDVNAEEIWRRHRLDAKAAHPFPRALAHAAVRVEERPATRLSSLRQARSNEVQAREHL